tara:strand:- start:1164 stop:1754 length:591 start_codon:yes stop_codon:yes gene_type:complete
MGYNIDDVYDSMAYAETGSFPDPWIRTTGKTPQGSSAYGPVGLTGGEKNKAMMWNIYHDPKLAEKIGLKEDEREYVSSFLEQASKFLDPVSDEDLSTYGYGGPGVLRTKEDKGMYEAIAKKLFKYELEVTSKGNIDEFLRRMRGPTKHFSGGKDVGHTTRFKDKLSELTTKRKILEDKADMMPDETLIDTLGKIQP